jgi:hypothetical protein
MALLAKETATFEPVEEGMHHAACYAIYDLGHQYSEKFKKSIHQILISWELPDSRIKIDVDGESKDLPKSISRTYSLTLGKKSNLRKDLQSWRGKAFSEEELKGWDISKILKVNCLIQIIHQVKDENTYAQIAAITPLMKGMQPEPPENPVKLFIFGESSEVPEGTPEWILEKLKAAEEWKTSPLAEPVEKPAWIDQAGPPPDGNEENVPF